MGYELLDALATAMTGCTCTVTRLENGWSFGFQGPDGRGAGFFVSAPWRIVAESQIVHAVDDDGQRFGLPEPVDGEATTNELLADKRVEALTVDRATADLRVEFEGGIRLDVFNNSAGYEGWNGNFALNGNDITLVGGGGGNLSFVSAPHGSSAKVVVAQPLP